MHETSNHIVIFDVWGFIYYVIYIKSMHTTKYLRDLCFCDYTWITNDGIYEYEKQNILLLSKQKKK